MHRPRPRIFPTSTTCLAVFSFCPAGLTRPAQAWMLTGGALIRGRAKFPVMEDRSPLPVMSAEGGIGGGQTSSRANLAEMRQGFERTMDTKLVMEYVKELRERKELLISSLEATGGVITKEVYSIMEDLAEVNPSGDCGKADDKGSGHYSGMLNGYWIAASTLVPGVPYIYPDGSSSVSDQGPDSGGGTCTLGELTYALSGHECFGNFDPSSPVRPRRARFSVLRNTVKPKEMPNLVAIIRYGHMDATGAGSGNQMEDPEGAIIEAVRAANAQDRAAAEAGGAGVLAGGFDVNPKYNPETASLQSRAELEAAATAAMQASRRKGQRSEPAPDAPDEDGGVKIRAVWGVEGRNHLTWALESVDVDLGQQMIRTKPVPESDEARWNGRRRNLYEYYLDQDMFILAWKNDNPGPEECVVFVRDSSVS